MARTWKVERAAPLVVGVLVGLPTLLAFYPPMTDLPLHEAVVGVLRHWGDEAYAPRGLYVLALGQANQLFHVLGWLVSFVVGTRWAVKLVIFATQVAIFDAGARFADRMGRARTGALLFAPLALGFTYYWGFVANLLGFALLFYALPLLDRASESPTRRRVAGATAALVLLFFAHGSAYVIAVAISVGLALIRARTIRGALVGLLPPAIATALGGLAYVRSRAFVTGGEPVYPTFFFPLAKKLVEVPQALVGPYDGDVPVAIFALGVVAVLLLALARVRARAAAPSEPRAPREAFVARRFEIVAAALGVAYLATPYHYLGVMFLHHRFLGPCWGILATLAAPPRGAASRVHAAAAAVSAIVVVAVVGAAIPQFVDADRVDRDAEALIERIPMRSATALAVVDRASTTHVRTFDPSSAAARVVAERGGRASPSLVTSPASAVQIRRDLRYDEYDARVARGGSRALVPSHDLDRFAWVLARSRDAWLRGLLVEALRPDATLVAERGEWMLFRSTHAVADLASPPPGPPPPGAETLIERVVRLENERREHLRPAPPSTAP